jgi:hypothetical protein
MLLAQFLDESAQIYPQGLAQRNGVLPDDRYRDPRWRSEAATSSPIKPEPITAQLRASLALARIALLSARALSRYTCGSPAPSMESGTRLRPGRQEPRAVARCPAAAQRELVIGRVNANRRIAGDQIQLDRFVIFCACAVDSSRHQPCRQENLSKDSDDLPDLAPRRRPA